MKKLIAAALAVSVIVGVFAQKPRPQKEMIGAVQRYIETLGADLEWESLGNRMDADSSYYYVQRLTVFPRRPLSRICFNMLGRDMRTLSPEDTLIEIIPRYYAIASPRFARANGDTVVVDILTRGPLTWKAYVPSAFHGVNPDGSPVDIRWRTHPIDRRRDLWAYGDADNMPHAEEIFAANDSLRTAYPIGRPYDIIPGFKSVKAGKKFTDVKSEEFRQIKHSNPEYCRITVKKGKVKYEYASERARRQAVRAFREKVLLPSHGRLPEAVIEDWPDFNTRGVMVDIARNYLPLPELKKLISELSLQRFNTLQFHFADDEAWRLEIPSFPELTAVGGRRGYSLDDGDFLNQVFTGTGNPDDRTTAANGHYSRCEFIDLLHFCDSLGVEVIPEVESPGHARAAVYAMENRFCRTGDPSLRLIEDNDTSRYTTASEFHDGLMNPSLPGPYVFMEAVVDDIADMYHDAGLDMKAFHIGGDEVPEGAWDGAPSMPAFMAEHSLRSQHDVHGYFVERLSEMLARRGIKMCGWQEIATGYGDDFNAKVAPRSGYINAWHTGGSDTQKGLEKALADGFPIMLSNVDRYYMDMCYTPHPMEPGLKWGGYVDEIRSLGGYPSEMLPVAGDAKGNVVGVMAHLWSETMRSPADFQTMFFPKSLGVAERGWNAKETLTPAEFTAIYNAGDRRRWERNGMAWHLRQPGIRINGDGMVEMNVAWEASPLSSHAPFGDITVRYSTDGSEPTSTSEEYTAPFPAPASGEIRAKAFSSTSRAASLTTVLFL